MLFFVISIAITQDGIQEARQSDVYDVIGPELLDSIMLGYNASLFAYGQTGSGSPSLVN
jgi:hypothetical protein